jgi:tetratricopeptide (TPR) repeat protein/NAD-dependent SIR2 family protein deacetylase
MPEPSPSTNAELIQLAQDVKSSVRKKDDRAGATTRLALFLGAGASISSGIISAAAMTSHFKEVVYRRYGVSFGTDEKAENGWLKTQDWYTADKTSDYSKLFEKCYDTERKRRSYIESIIEKAEPSFGYMVLANLIAEGYFKTVITTNFDDLVYTACTTYTSVRPVVYSLGGFATEMTLTDERPRILKLHGDFLYSSLKNTGAELTKQDENMAREVGRVFSEHDGIVVVGYSGCDESVMKLLRKLPQGKTLYWCYRKGSPLSRSVKKLASGTGKHLVEIEGFDELMNFIREFVELGNRRLAKSFETNLRRLTELLFKFDDNSTVDFVDEMTRSIKIFSLYIQANRALANTDDAESERVIRELLKIEKDNPISWYNLGLVLAKDPAHLKEAEDAYREALKAKPNDADAWHNLGVLLAADPDRSKEARDAFREAINASPDYASAWSNLGALLAEDPDRPKEAENAYREAIKADPDYADAWYNLGVLLTKDPSRLKETEDAYREAIRANPDFFSAWSNLGALLAEDPARPKEAENAYREALKANPDFADAWYNLGLLLAKDPARAKEAEDAYREAIKAKPDHASAWYNLGVLLGENPDRLKEAEDAYREAIKAKPDDAAPWYNLGVLLMNFEDRIDDAISLLTKYLTDHPEDAEIMLLLGSILFDSGKITEAREYFRKVKALVAKSPKLLEDLRYTGLLSALEEEKQSKKPAGRSKKKK